MFNVLPFEMINSKEPVSQDCNLLCGTPWESVRCDVALSRRVTRSLGSNPGGKIVVISLKQKITVFAIAN